MATEEKPPQDPLTTTNALITYDEAAKRLGLALGTLYALVHAGRIPHVRLGKRLVRFRPAEIERWLESHSVPAATTTGTAR